MKACNNGPIATFARKLCRYRRCRPNPARQAQKSAIEGEWYCGPLLMSPSAGMTLANSRSLVCAGRSAKTASPPTAYGGVQDSEAPSALPGTAYQGAPIAAFPVLSHFDVQRIYNEATGEQSNVIVENTTDRPWYEREYIRVDWSTNLLANFDFMAGGESGLGITAQSASYAVTNPSDPDAPVFAVKTGADAWTDYRDPMQWGQLESVDYFDITTKLQLTPETFPIYFDDDTYEEWPACWFYEYQVPWIARVQTIKVRASFLRVFPSDYEPLAYPDNYTRTRR